MNKIIFLFAVSILIACIFERKPEIGIYLSSDTCKYWRIHDERVLKDYCGGFFFKSNGTYIEHGCWPRTGERFLEDYGNNDRKV